MYNWPGILIGISLTNCCTQSAVDWRQGYIHYSPSQRVYRVTNILSFR